MCTTWHSSKGKRKKRKREKFNKKIRFYWFFLKKRSFLYTLGFWANSIWVGVPGLRETACDCCCIVVGSFIGETDRSLLQGRNHTHRYKLHFREGSFSACRQTRVCSLCVCVYVYVCIVRWFVQDGVYAVRKHWKCGTYKSEGGEKKNERTGKKNTSIKEVQAENEYVWERKRERHEYIVVIYCFFSFFFSI